MTATGIPHPLARDPKARAQLRELSYQLTSAPRPYRCAAGRPWCHKS